jgi:hypothetical protein
VKPDPDFLSTGGIEWPDAPRRYVMTPEQIARSNAWCERWTAEIAKRMGDARMAAGLPRDMPDPRRKWGP